MCGLCDCVGACWCCCVCILFCPFVVWFVVLSLLFCELLRAICCWCVLMCYVLLCSVML